MPDKQHIASHLGTTRDTPVLPASVKAARVLFLLHGAMWVLLAVLTAATMGRTTGGQSTLAWMLAVLMLANAAVMFWLGLRLAPREKLLYYVALAVLVVNIVLGVTDQVGLWDVVALLLGVALLALLILTRRTYTATP